MDFAEFTGEVQHRLELGTQGEAVRAARAVLTTLGERLPPEEAADLAGPLPMEIDRFLLHEGAAEGFDYDEFVRRVADRANADESDAVYYAQAVVALVCELVPEGEVHDVAANLPSEFSPLFELAEQDVAV